MSCATMAASPDPADGAAGAAGAAARRAGRTRGALLAAGLALLLVHAASLGVHDLWYDETYSVRLARMPWRELVATTAADVHPPLYYLLLKPFAGAPGDAPPWRVRLPGWLAGMAALAFVVAAANRAGGREAALAAAALGLAGSTLLHFGAEARPYTLAAAGVAATLWAVVRLGVGGGEEGRAKGVATPLVVALFGLLGGCLAHNLVALGAPLLVLAATAWLAARGEPRRARAFVGVAAAAGALLLPWGRVVLDQARSMGEVLDWMPEPTAAGVVDAVVRLPFLHGEPFVRAGGAAGLALASLLALALGTGAATAWRAAPPVSPDGAARRARLLGAASLLGTLGLFALAAAAVSATAVRVFYPSRFAMILWAPWLLAVSLLVAAIPRAAARRALVAALVLAGVADQAARVAAPVRPRTARMAERAATLLAPGEALRVFPLGDAQVWEFFFHAEELAARGVSLPHAPWRDVLALHPDARPTDLLLAWCEPRDGPSPEADAAAPYLRRARAALRHASRADDHSDQLGGWRLVRLSGVAWMPAERDVARAEAAAPAAGAR